MRTCTLTCKHVRERACRTCHLYTLVYLYYLANFEFGARSARFGMYPAWPLAVIK